jgi:hypothetical protein
MAEFTEEELAADAVTADTIDAQEEPQGQPRDERGQFAAQDNEPAGEQAERANKSVPHQALHQEREGHKQTRAQLQAAQEQLRSIAEMRARILAPKEEQRPPANEDDPSGIAYLTEQMEQLRQSSQQRDQREQFTETEARRLNVLSSQLSASEAAYKQSKPDYDNAAQHLIQARMTQLRLLGVPDTDMRQMLRDEAADLAETAINNGRDPADLVYEYAQSYGYQPQQGNSQQGGEHPMLAAIANGQRTRSFGNGRAAPSQGDPNAAAIAAMDEGEFGRMYASDPQFRTLVDRLG